jgi:hypothetical protein
MSRNVTFKTLWLVSESEQKAKKQTFSKAKTILFGTNGTGKSRITKNLFWTLGCSPEKHIAPRWDPDTIGALELEFAGEYYLVVRQRKDLGLFSLEGELIAAADTLGEWDKIMANLFGYKLMLRRNANPNPARVGIDYLTLPFYIDQDGGWGATWSSYSTLNQFRKWQKPVFEAFIGLRPNGYFTEYQRWEVANDQLRVMQEKFETQRTAFSRVRQILPKTVPVLNTERFENELVDLGEKARELQRRQSELREKLVSAINLKEKINAELRLAVESHRGLTDDLGFISEFDQATIECPTCGTQHTNSFHARLRLTQDAHSMSLLVGELRDERKTVSKRHEAIFKLLQETEDESKKIKTALNEEPEHIQSKDLLLAAHSVQTLDNAFDRVTLELTKEMQTLDEEVEKYRLAYKQYEDLHRLKAVKGYYNGSISYYSGRLNVPPEEQIIKAKPGERGKVGGSSAPRSLLAVHMAMLRTNSEYGDMPQFPFVVDTLQQSGQDLDNLSSMIEILNGSISPSHQTILALEMLPPAVDISGFDVVYLTEKRQLLNEQDFKNVAFLEPRLQSMRRAIAIAKSEKKASSR